MDSVASVIYPFAQSIAHALDVTSQRAEPYETDGIHIPQEQHEQKVKEFHDLIHKPAFTLDDLPAYLLAIRDTMILGADDRQLLLEKVLVLMSRIKDDGISMKIQERVINLLYNDLPHPPASYLSAYDCQAPSAIPSSRRVNYAFRSADGSNYNPLFPSLGKAGFPYARSVAGTSVPKYALPDPGLVFDTLLRRDEFTPHPGGISSLFFAFANLVIHSIFDTNHSDWTINDTSSYLDLSILYGKSQEQQDQVRRRDGTGQLWNDVFADGRLLLMPPATCALLVLFSRNHNYVAQKLLDINQNGTFVSPASTDEKTRIQQDDDIFHRARMVNCGLFMQIILGDYVGAILGLVRDGSNWRLNPMMPIRKTNREIVPVGEGNVVSIEFNCLYRWHATLSKPDEEFTGKVFSKVFEGKDPSTVTIDDFRRAAHEHLIPEHDVKKRTFGGLIREQNGHFRDDDLARIIQDATESFAGAFKARGIPEVMRVVEILGIEQARSWGTCSLNEFRRFMGLRPYTNFSEWNRDPEIHKAAAALYKNIENLELHVGLQAEEAKLPGPGAGLCPGFTISRAILGDAVCLTRGDRFLTSEFTPFNLTAWGFADCQFDTKDGSYGGMLTQLLFRSLPNHFPASSAYAHFPFLVPTFMKDNLANKEPDVVNKYIWTRPHPPPSTVVVDTYADVDRILNDPLYVSVYDSRLFDIVKDGLGLTVPETESRRIATGRTALEKLLPLAHSHGSWAEYLKETTQSLIFTKSIQHDGSELRYIDIAQDIINLLPVYLISEEILGLPLKTATNPDGIWYEQDVYQKFADVGSYVFLNLEPTHDWRLRESSMQTYREISKYAKGHINSINSKFGSVSDSLNHLAIETRHCHEFIRLARDANPSASPEELSAYIFCAVVPTAVFFSQAIVQVIDFYLDDERRREREDIGRLVACLDDEGAKLQITAYVREALRLNPVFSGVYRTAAKDGMIGSNKIQAGDRVYVSVVEANLDTSLFGTKPTLPEFDRPPNKSGILGFGEDGLLSDEFFKSTVSTIVGSILSLKNIKRAPGKAGKLARFQEDWYDSRRTWYLDSKGRATPFPDSLVVQYDLE